MSYDLMVFNPVAAPKNVKDFMNWYDNQTEWKESHCYDHPDVTTAQLRNWYIEMIQIFPDCNGIFTHDNDTDNDNAFESNYAIGKDVIYVAFSWSLAESAYNTMYQLAEKHDVGFFDTTSGNDCIFFPINGRLQKIAEKNSLNETRRPWWKIW